MPTTGSLRHRALESDAELTTDAAVALSPRLRAVLYAAAVAIALAPVLVELLGLLPTYREQGRFLIYYAPFMCLISVAYLLYVRDSLARIMFAHLLRPPPAADGDRFFSRVRLKRLWTSTRRIGLMLLPVPLFLGSITCINGYTTVFAESLHEAALGNPSSSVSRSDSVASSRATVDTSHPVAGSSPQAPIAVPDSAVVRSRLMEGTAIEEIPYFAELSFLYIGVFLGPLLAVLLMGVREYAKDALQLTERDMVLGRILVDSE